ncbi:uncharacterized protein EAE97_004988 [Botrytis byssoidea]|uniref:Uncharacterized protein n=1 Tax=Botrytis byssoidea TaxID=139641 RepID=A0A9P5M3N5_9HELO|nr:uncharacterized protein EAE97_004988 [Botrytis byssoidea]KAF7945950.1 hypothetical protein EAE97_004988 [Botrytis byssoidea]
MLTNTSKSSNSNPILEIYNPNSEYQSDSDDMVNVRELTAEHRQEIAQARADHRQELAQARQEISQARADHRQELAQARQEISQARQELTAEHRQEISQARADHRQELAQARQEISQADQILITTHAKVATLEEKLIHKVSHNEELNNQLNECNASLLLLREEGVGRQVQARDNQIQKLKRHIQSMYILSAGLAFFLGLALLLLARVLSGEN